jgi:hypothetical protein
MRVVANLLGAKIRQRDGYVKICGGPSSPPDHEPLDYPLVARWRESRFEVNFAP